MSLPDIVLNFYNSVIIIDERANQHWIVTTGAPEKTKSAWLKRAEATLASIRNVIHQAPSSFQTKPLPHRFVASLQSNLTKGRYIEAVLKMKAAILNGDIFQANLSQQFRARLLEGISPLDLYFKLMSVNPAPFSAFITIPNYGAIISASPERFIKLTHRRVETCPIKGTRRRVQDEALDQQLADELQNSEKDRAENTMIVDLMRNDLSKVCEPHSVHVEALCALKSFETVHHLVSHITGRLKADRNALDLLKATFPPGSITGAPKIRAMEIITELEQQARGPYCGSIGYLSFTGDMDLSVVIRTYFTHHDEVFFNAGGAIVLDSSPEDEYAESMLKAQALIEALGILS